MKIVPLEQKDIMLRFLFPYKSYPASVNIMLVVLRLLFGGLLMWHGLAKIADFESLLGSFPDPLGIGTRMSLYLTIFAEVFCSVGVILGAFYRLALLPIIFAMAIALLVVHRGQPLAARELALVFEAMFVLLFIMGAGRYSLDNIIATLLHPESVAMGSGVQSSTRQPDSEHPTDDAPRQ